MTSGQVASADSSLESKREIAVQSTRKVRRGSATFEELNLEALLEKPGDLVCPEDGCPCQTLEEPVALAAADEGKTSEELVPNQETGVLRPPKQGRSSEPSRASSDSHSRSSNEFRESVSIQSLNGRSNSQGASLDKNHRSLPPSGGRTTPSPREQAAARASRSNEEFPLPSSRSTKERISDGVAYMRTSGERDRSSHPITEAVRSKSGLNRFADMFKLPHTQRLVDRFSCGLQRTIILQGTLYIFNDYVCFRSSVLSGANIVIPISDIVSIRRERNLLLDNAIRFTLQDGTSYFFVSFLFPARTYRSLKETGLFKKNVFEDRSEDTPRYTKTAPEPLTGRNFSKSDASAAGNDSQSEKQLSVSISEEEEEENEDEEEAVRSVEQSMAIRLFAAGQLPSYENRKKHLLQNEKTQLSRVCAVTLPCNNARLFRAFFIDLEEEEALHRSLEKGQSSTPRTGNNAKADDRVSKITTPSSSSDSSADNAATSADDTQSNESESVAFSARSNFLALQAKLGHLDMQLGKWHLDPELGFVREFRYRKPLEPAPMSPKETWMTEHMMFYVSECNNERLQTIYLEIQGTSHDVPFGDSFVAEQLYIFRPAQEKSRFECELEVYAGAHFHRWSMIAGTIRKRTIAGVEKTASVFVQMARELCTTSLCRRLQEQERAQYEGGVVEPGTPHPAQVTTDLTEETAPQAVTVETKLEPITFDALPLPTRYVLLPFYRISVMASSAAYWDATLLNAFTILCITMLSFWVFRLQMSNQQLVAELRRADEQLHFLRDVLADRLGH